MTNNISCQITPDYLVPMLQFKQQKKSQGPRKGMETLKEPGFESKMDSFDAEILRFNQQKNQLRGLLKSFKRESIECGDCTFNAYTCICEAIGNQARQFFHALAYQNLDGTSAAGPSGSDDGIPYKIKRPTTLLAETKAYIQALRLVDNWLKTDFTQVVLDLFVDQAEGEASRKGLNDAKPNPQGAKSAVNKSKINVNQSLLLTYTNWFLDFVATKGISGQVVFAPAKKSFVSKTTGGGADTFHAEEYMDYNGMCCF